MAWEQGKMVAKDPAAISLFNIASLFEHIDAPSLCPFGHGWCGTGAPCPLHFTIEEPMNRNRAFMKETRLSVFVGQKPGKQPFPSRD